MLLQQFFLVPFLFFLETKIKETTALLSMFQFEPCGVIRTSSNMFLDIRYTLFTF